MSVEGNKALIEKFMHQIFNQHDLSAIDELLDHTFVSHSLPPGVPPNREGLRTSVEMYLRAFPDLKCQVDNVLGDGDRAFASVYMTGTNLGEFFGMPPTGREMRAQAMDIVRIKDGKITEHWAVEDMLAVMQQLGLGPQ